MGITVGGSKSGAISEMNVVPLIDVLLVLLVIFMIIPHRQTGLRAEIPRPAEPASGASPDPGIVVVQGRIAQDQSGSGELGFTTRPVAGCFQVSS
jgi:biopolymer transport protein ExbD